MKHLIIFAFAALLSFNSFAQFGVKGGCILSGYDKYTLQTPSRAIEIKFPINLGYSLGGFYAIKLSNKFYIQPEIFYNRIIGDYKMHLVQLPVLLKFQIGKPYLIGGISEQLTIRSKDDPKTWSNAMIGGIGVNIPHKDNFIVLECRATRDLTNSYYSKNSSINLLIGFMF